MENKKLNLKKYLICTLLIAAAVSAMATQTAFARETAPSQTPPEGTASTTDGNPILTATLDNATIETNDTPLLDRPQDPLLNRVQDNSTTSPDDNATLYTIQDNLTEENPSLIASQAQPENIATVLGIAALAAAVTAAAVVGVVRLRKKI
jgi:hypothetical protein